MGRKARSVSRLEEPGEQVTRVRRHQAPKYVHWVRQQGGHFRTWWVLFGGSGLRNGWRCRREEEVRLSGQHLGGGTGCWEGLRREGILVWATVEQPGEQGRPEG